jgi:folate-binding protein YgfZ
MQEFSGRTEVRSAFDIIEGSAMTRTQLYEKLAASGARMGEYAGAETALAFGPHHDHVQAEFDAIRAGCGVYDLGWRAKLALTGGDRVRWLNGMVTNNIRDLAQDHGTYNFVLSPQGRIQADCYAYNRGEYILVGTEMSQVERLKEIFEKYIIMDDVEVTDLSDKLTAMGVQGPLARKVLERAGFSGLDVGPMELRDVTWRDPAGNEVGLTITRMASEEFVTYELWFAPPNAGAIWDALVAAGATPVGTDALELFRIAAGVPKYGQDIRDRDLPQETNQSHALHFAKGCYVGQEIVERIRSRGQVHRLFCGFAIDGVVGMVSHERAETSGGRSALSIHLDPDIMGAKLTLDGKEVGEITSAALVDDRVLALGYARREHATACTTLQAGDVTARVEQVPFAEAKHPKSNLVMNS